MKKKEIFTYFTLFIVITLSLQSCGAIQTRKEKEIASHYSEQKAELYADRLVDIRDYQTNGAIYQEKYYKLLIGLAVEIIENRKIDIALRSLGFYFDMKSDERSKLFLGFDIESGTLTAPDYAEAAIKLVRQDLREILNTIHSCASIFNEKEIVGMVIGWKWHRGGTREQLNIWIPHHEVTRFINMRLTFTELIQLSIVTDTEGKIIRLPI